jgi:UDP-4-amino-4,6-dideoxy-N-acetyl-beta-L-altrosamine N-acetyltransferase
MAEETVVRPMCTADLPVVLAWRNHPEIRRHMLTRHEISLDEHVHWFESACLDPTRRLLVVEDAARPLGFVQLSGVLEEPGAVVEWGFYAAPGALPGSGSRLGLAALSYAFDQLRVHKICGQSLGSNSASIRFHMKLGFQQEGVLRQHKRMNGRYEDLICFGLLCEEWRLRPKETE